MTEDERRHSMEKRKRVQQALHDWLVRGKIVAKLKHDQGLQLPKTVSYTHLTLPTIYSV